VYDNEERTWAGATFRDDAAPAEVLFCYNKNMRLLFSSILLLVMMVSSAGWYLLELTPCPTPQFYRIGQLDPEFDLSHDAAKAEIASATAVWQELTSRPLFIYDERAAFTVNFIYDERQATSEESRLMADEIDRLAAEIAAFDKEFKKREEALAAARTLYDERRVSFEAKQQTFNLERTTYEQSIERNAREEIRLERERRLLNAEVTALQRAATELNARGQALNDFAASGNEIITKHNALVVSYNEQFGERREFTQGDYQGDRINIYTFTDRLELQRVLVHEFGHALGLDHVEDETAIMYHILGAQPETPTLQPDDRNAFWAVCQSDELWQVKVATWVRTLLFPII